MAAAWASASRGAGAAVSVCPPGSLGSHAGTSAGTYDSIVVEDGERVSGAVLGEVRSAAVSNVVGYRIEGFWLGLSGFYVSGLSNFDLSDLSKFEVSGYRSSIPGTTGISYRARYALHPFWHPSIFMSTRTLNEQKNDVEYRISKLCFEYRISKNVSLIDIIITILKVVRRPCAIGCVAEGARWERSCLVLV